jgi:hypothetical protein
MENLEKLCIQGAKIDRLHPRPFASRVPLKKTSLKELTLLNCDVSSNTLEKFSHWSIASKILLSRARIEISFFLLGLIHVDVHKLTYELSQHAPRIL